MARSVGKVASPSLGSVSTLVPQRTQYRDERTGNADTSLCRSTLVPAGLACVKKLSSSDAWHAAKQLFSEKAVEVHAVLLDAGNELVYVQGSVTTLNVNAAAFPHCHPPARPTAADSAISVQLCLQSKSGQLLDATCSCCPGGANIVLGSICPCAAAVLLTAAKQATPPSAGDLKVLVSSSSTVFVGVIGQACKGSSSAHAKPLQEALA